MAEPYQPPGYSTVAPYLIVSDARATIAFLQRVFGAQELRRFQDPDGRILATEGPIEDSVLMLADSAEGWPPLEAHIHVYVRDVDQTYSLALAAGAASNQEPVKIDDPNRRAGVRDAHGTTWWIATTLN